MYWRQDRPASPCPAQGVCSLSTELVDFSHLSSAVAVAPASCRQMPLKMSAATYCPGNAQQLLWPASGREHADGIRVRPMLPQRGSLARSFRILDGDDILVNLLFSDTFWLRLATGRRCYFLPVDDRRGDVQRESEGLDLAFPPPHPRPMERKASWFVGCSLKRGSLARGLSNPSWADHILVIHLFSDTFRFCSAGRSVFLPTVLFLGDRWKSMSLIPHHIRL